MYNNSDNEISETKTNSPVNHRLTAVFVFVLTVITALLLFKAYLLIDEKISYDKETLYDPIFNMKVVEFPVKDGWRPYGKVTVNENSIPNFETFFIAAVYPEEQTEIKLFSTQYETDIQKTEEFGINEEISEEPDLPYEELSNSVKDYIFSVIKKMNPKAENIQIIKKFTNNTHKNQKKYLKKIQFLKTAYSDINPTTPKSKSKLKDVIIEPVSLLFSFNENGYRYYLRIDCDFTSFVQVFEEKMMSKKIRQKIRYVKCENVYTYQVLEKYYKKNMRHYEVFKKNAKPDVKWAVTLNEAKRNKIHNDSYSTTQTIMSGDKFNPELLKNLIYTIEYMSDTDKKYLAEDLSIDL